jgi:hypothetical protein
MTFGNPTQTEKSSLQLPLFQFGKNAFNSGINADFVLFPMKIGRDEIAIVPVLDVEGEEMHKL